MSFITNRIFSHFSPLPPVAPNQPLPECSLCLEVVDPKTSVIHGGQDEEIGNNAQQHPFCYKCVDQLVKVFLDKKRQQVLSCPNCRAELFHKKDISSMDKFRIFMTYSGISPLLLGIATGAIFHSLYEQDVLSYDNNEIALPMVPTIGIAIGTTVVKTLRARWVAEDLTFSPYTCSFVALANALMGLGIGLSGSEIGYALYENLD